MASPNLTDLPFELRLQIYTYVFTSATVLPTGMPMDLKGWPALRIFPAASLLLVNRQIHNETQQLFWELVTLDAEATSQATFNALRPGKLWQQHSTLRNLRLHANGTIHELLGPEQLYSRPGGLAAEVIRGNLSTLCIAIYERKNHAASAVVEQVSRNTGIWELHPKLKFLEIEVFPSMYEGGGSSIRGSGEAEQLKNHVLHGIQQESLDLDVVHVGFTAAKWGHLIVFRIGRKETKRNIA